MSELIGVAESKIKEAVKEVYMPYEAMFKEKYREVCEDEENGFISEMRRACGRPNYDYFCLLNLLWTLSMNPWNDELLERIRESLSKKDFVTSWKEIKRNKIEYKKIIENSDIIKCKKRKYNIIVPVKNREEHLQAFLSSSLSTLSNYNDWMITIIFQEDDDKLFNEYKQILQDVDNINLINMPASILKPLYGENMNRSLCYNVASKIVPCEWQMNHDIDLIFMPDFCENVESKSKTCKKWFQPYRGSRVVYLDRESSDAMVNALSKKQTIQLRTSYPPMNNTPHTGGAPGGCVVVNWKDFQEMGGYDPEFIWGYGPEDQMFWKKLEYFYRQDDSILETPRAMKGHPFVSYDVYSHETNVELYHLWHPPTKVESRYPFWNLFFASYINNCFTKNDVVDWFEMSKDNYLNG